VPEVAHDSLQMLSPWPPGSIEASNSINLSTSSRAILSQELKMLRLRISDYNKSPVIDAICQKVSFLNTDYIDRYGD